MILWGIYYSIVYFYFIQMNNDTLTFRQKNLSKWFNLFLIGFHTYLSNNISYITYLIAFQFAIFINFQQLHIFKIKRNNIHYLIFSSQKEELNTNFQQQQNTFLILYRYYAEPDNMILPDKHSSYSSLES